MRKVFITGTAGFIGYHLAERMLADGFQVTGYDGMTDYYDVVLKRRRHQNLSQNPNFRCVEGMLEDSETLRVLVQDTHPDIIVHLAAQAGVRYSLENPRSYIDSNLIGTFNVMECAREIEVGHLLMSSTSSVYGANTDMPFGETDKADTPLTIYAATKKANESMAHSYAHLWNIPTTMFRFFSVYGPWGRPDMALFKFVKAALKGEPIDVYNNGDMVRDFTYISDLVHAIRLLCDVVPKGPDHGDEIARNDSLSPAAPFRIVNIGNNKRVHLMTFIHEIEKALGLKIDYNYMGMQKGDVHATWANADLLQELTGYKPQTTIQDGVRHFIDWYRSYYNV